MSNEPSSDLFSDGDTERVVYEQKKIQGSGLTSNFSVISLDKNGSSVSGNTNKMDVYNNESTIAYNNKAAPKMVNDEEDESTIVYNNVNNKPAAVVETNNNNAPAEQAKKEPPKLANEKKKGIQTRLTVL